MHKKTEESDRNAADMLAELLGDLPLALEHAGAYIAGTSETIKSYSVLFLEQQKANNRNFLRIKYKAL